MLESDEITTMLARVEQFEHRMTQLVGKEAIDKLEKRFMKLDVNMKLL